MSNSQHQIIKSPTELHVALLNCHWQTAREYILAYGCDALLQYDEENMLLPGEIYSRNCDNVYRNPDASVEDKEKTAQEAIDFALTIVEKEQLMVPNQNQKGLEAVNAIDLTQYNVAYENKAISACMAYLSARASLLGRFKEWLDSFFQTTRARSLQRKKDAYDIIAFVQVARKFKDDLFLASAIKSKVILMIPGFFQSRLYDKNLIPATEHYLQELKLFREGRLPADYNAYGRLPPSIEVRRLEIQITRQQALSEQLKSENDARAVQLHKTQLEAERLAELQQSQSEELKSTQASLLTVLSEKADKTRLLGELRKDNEDKEAIIAKLMAQLRQQQEEAAQYHSNHRNSVGSSSASVSTVSIPSIDKNLVESRPTHLYLPDLSPLSSVGDDDTGTRTPPPIFYRFNALTTSEPEISGPELPTDSSPNSDTMIHKLLDPNQQNNTEQYVKVNSSMSCSTISIEFP